jgi:hypothetical protein
LWLFQVFTDGGDYRLTLNASVHTGNSHTDLIDMPQRQQKAGYFSTRMLSVPE